MCSSAKPHGSAEQDSSEHLKSDGAEGEDQKDLDQIEEEEDPYNLIPEDIYDTVDADMSSPVILNRPPAPLPRPESEPEKPVIVTGTTPSLLLYTTDVKKLRSGLTASFFDSILNEKHIWGKCSRKNEVSFR